jgi:hypothetical protein
MALTGTALDPTRDVGSLRLTWWRRPLVRFAVGVLVWAGLLLPAVLMPRRTWTVSWGSFIADLTPQNIVVWAAVLLMPFLRMASYRKRDVLLIALVPIYGPMVAGLVVSRLMALPLRDWTPREDELPRVVRVPRSRGAYVVKPTFGEAEALRTKWCRNPRHQHPYASWREARTFYCQQSVDD